MIKLTHDDQTQALADAMRSDKLFRSKNVIGSMFRKLLMGYAIEIGHAEGIFQEISDEYDIENTTKLIEEWERVLGIPDDCFHNTGTIEERRRNVLTKLTALGVSTEQEFIDLAATFGLTIEIDAGGDVLTFPFTFPFIVTNLNPRFVMVVTISSSEAAGVFPYVFPFILGSGEGIRIITCLFQKLVPASVKVNFIII